MRFPNAEEICLVRNPTESSPEKTATFVAACREMAEFHYANSADIRALYDRNGFDPASIRADADIERIPALGVSAMKSFLMTSLDPERAVLKLTSSGTRGQKTQIWFDADSLRRVQSMMDVYLDQEGMVSDEPTNYAVFNYDPEDAGDLGVAYTEKNQLRFAPVNEVIYAIKKDARGDWQFRKEAVLASLERYARENRPVRLFAMPGFLYEFIQYLRTVNAGPFRFPPNSWILTGGGWKAAEDKKITREELRAICAEAFGIPVENQRDAYGMAEHCAPYFECREHRFHVAVFNRLIIRDPVSYRPLPDGEAGLLELITPFNAMMPTLAILSTDYAKIRADACPCGDRTPTFEVLGRAGMTKHKGCALVASEIVRR